MKLSLLTENADIIETNADFELEVTGVSYNTSTLRKGDIFIAITGFKTDGHIYIKDAAEKGAVCVICEKKPEAEIPYILVKDTRIALAVISSAWYKNPASKLKLIGVTGTNGKTSVTYMLKHIIEKCCDCKVGLIGTIGNFIGDRQLESKHTTPDSLELCSILDKMVLEGCKYVVMEVSSHALSLHRVHGIKYEIGVFTNLTPEHLDFHKTMQEYAAAKAILFSNCRKSIVNIDDKYSELMIKSSTGEVITYGADNENADLKASQIKLYSEKAEFDAVYKNNINHITVHIPGRFTVYNIMAAFLSSVELGLKTEDITRAIVSFEGVTGRAEVVNTGKPFTVIVDYAHTPDALENIIKTARSITDGRVITLFGCGGDRDKEKRPLMGKIATRLSDIVFITSDNPRTEKPDAIIQDILAGIDEDVKKQKHTGSDQDNLSGERSLVVIENRREAIYKALEILLARDVLLIAGKGHENYQIIGEEKIHFDDREVVEDYFQTSRKSKRKMHQSA